MLLRALISALLVLLAAAHASAEGCTGCCCGKFGVGPGGSLPPPRYFAYGCYFGDGTNGRNIYTGINAADSSLLLVNKVSTSESFCNRWLTPEMVSATIQGRGQANCTTNEDANLFSGFSGMGFVVNNNTTDPGDSLNENLEQYCWYQWNDTPGWSDTFTYVGDGSSPRALNLGVDLSGDSAAWIQNRNNGDGYIPSNGIVMRSSNMPTNASYVWGHVAAGVNDGNGIRAFTTTGLTLGSHVNENGVTYFGAWWHWAVPNTGGVFNWTGNGTAGGGNCGTGANVQVFGGLNGDPTGVLTVEDFFDDGCAHQECDALRALNLSPNLAGPSHIPGTEDWYDQPQASPDDTNIGYFGANGFAARGGATTDASCNDNTQPYYAAYWTGTPPPNINTPIPTVTVTPPPPTATHTGTPTITATSTSTPVASNTPTATAEAVADWCAAGAFDACWRMNEASNTTRASTGTCTTDCALANTGTVTLDATAGHFLAGAGGAAADTAITDNLSCAAGTCDELNLSAVTAATWGCHGYVGTDAEQGDFINWSTAALRYSAARATANNNCQCRGRNAAGSTVTAISALNSWTAGTLASCICTFDDTANEIRAFGAATGGTAQTLSDIGNTATGNLQVAGSDGGWTGTVDECFVTKVELADTDICRICACGLGGAQSPCTCNGASYVSNGNYANCGSCTLPACNKAAPDGINTPTPTNTGVANTPTATATVTVTPTVTQTPTAISVTFPSAQTNVCTVGRTDSVYPPGIGTDVTLAQLFVPSRSVTSGNFDVYLACVRWLTAPLPNTATVLSATATVTNIASLGDADNRLLTAGWWTGETSPCLVPYALAAATDANTGIDITSLSVSGSAVLPLSSPASNVDLTSFTGVCFYISGAQPTGSNLVESAFVGSDPIELTVTYNP